MTSSAGTRIAAAGAVALTLVVLVASVRYGSTVAGGSDSYGYISEAALWRSGSLRVKNDPIVARSPWPFALETWTPLGYRPTPVRDAIVPVYPPGLPLIMALLQAALGYCGALIVVPISAGIAVAGTFLLARRTFDSPVIALFAAVLLATTPVFLYQAMNPMSDVPATAAWILTLLLVVSGRPLAAGIAASVALAIRPNLALAAVPLAIWIARTSRPRAGVLFAAGITPAVVLVALVNRSLYGSAMTSGYGTASEIYSLANFGTNVVQFARWAADGQTPLVFVGLAFLLAPRACPARIAHPVLLLGGFIASVCASYVLYAPFDAWWYLRFLLPLWPVLMTLTAAMLFGRSPRPTRLRSWVALACVIFMAGWGVVTATSRFAFDVWRGERRFVDAAYYIRDHTEVDAVVLTFQHSGSVRHYAGRLTLRWDALQPTRLDGAIEFLRASGRHPYLLLDGGEVEPFKARFAGASRAAALDWQPMARLDRPEALLFDLADRSSEPPIAMRNTGTGAPRWRCDPPAASDLSQNLQH